MVCSQVWGREKELASFLPKLRQGELGAHIFLQRPLDREPVGPPGLDGESAHRPGPK